MDCNKIKNSLFFLAEGSLKEDEASEIKLHLEQCPGCRKHHELFSSIERIFQEEKNLDPDDFFYTRLKSRMERLEKQPEKAKLQPAYIRIANILIIVIIIGAAALSGITLANRNYQYLGTSSAQQSDQQSGIDVDQDQYTSNFSEY